MDKVDIAAVLALSSALCVAIGDVLQQRATHRITDTSGGACSPLVPPALLGVALWADNESIPPSLGPRATAPHPGPWAKVGWISRRIGRRRIAIAKVAIVFGRRADRVVADNDGDRRLRASMPSPPVSASRRRSRPAEQPA